MPPVALAGIFRHLIGVPVAAVGLVIVIWARPIASEYHHARRDLAGGSRRPLLAESDTAWWYRLLGLCLFGASAYWIIVGTG